MINFGGGDGSFPRKWQNTKKTPFSGDLAEVIVDQWNLPTLAPCVGFCWMTFLSSERAKVGEGGVKAIRNVTHKEGVVGGLVGEW